MRYTTGLGSCASLLRRSLAVFIVSAIFISFGYLQAEAANIAVGGGCSLADAITSANTESATGGCTAGSGADTIVLTGTTYSLSVADNAYLLDNNGLPPITSTVTISGNGATIQRDLNLGCPTALVTETFRLLIVDNPGSLALKDVTLQNGCAQFGGGIYASNSSLSLLNSYIVSNTATQYGGGIYASGVVTVTQSAFISNTTLLQDGGGLFFSAGRVENSDFHLNSAGGEGGALGLSGSGDKYLLSNQIYENRAVENGAAIYLQGAVGHLDNNVIYGNEVTAPEERADIGLGAAPATLFGQHNTMVSGAFTGTTAIAVGLDNTRDRVFVTDTIISGYQFGLVSLHDATIVANGLLWDNVVSPTMNLGAGGITVTNAFTGSPAFVALAANNYHLSAPSLAIDRAVSNLPATDFDGDARPQGVASDIGFDEFIPTVTIEVSKTVGTDANGCASTDSLTVENGTAVFYCFTLHNSGDITLTQHVVQDEVLGVQTTLSFDLGPSATAQITRSLISALGPVTITAPVTNTVVITSSDGITTPVSALRVAQVFASATATDTATVDTEAPTDLPTTEQPEQGDNRLYLPSLH
jgi:predicted outer membrane repeat protein